MHLHSATAKKDVDSGGTVFKQLWDDVVMCIMRYSVRFLTGDFNMALWHVIVELRARGLQANLLAWYPWKNQHEADVRIDSCAIISIGPAMAVKRMHDQSVLGLEIEFPLPQGWENVEEIVKDENDGQMLMDKS